jgi:hypothetical protein
LAEDRRAAEMSTQWLQSAQTQSKSIREPVNDTRRDGREFGGTSQKSSSSWFQFLVISSIIFMIFEFLLNS